MIMREIDLRRIERAYAEQRQRLPRDLTERLLVDVVRWPRGDLLWGFPIAEGAIGPSLETLSVESGSLVRDIEGPLAIGGEDRWYYEFSPDGVRWYAVTEIVAPKVAERGQS